MTFNRGDILWVDFPFTDSALTKPRLALVISNDIVNKTSDYLLMQITSREKTDGLSLELNDIDYTMHPLKTKSYLRLHKIFVLNETQIIDKRSAVSKEFQEQVFERLGRLL